MTQEKKHRLSAKIWIEVDGKPVLGRGGADILEQIQKECSMSRAAVNLGMSYRYVWGYLKRIEKVMGSPIVHTFKGGRVGGGGARLTSLGENLLDEYTRAEIHLNTAISEAKDLAVFSHPASAKPSKKRSKPRQT